MSGAARPVLVVGAGPTGLTLACELARRGVATRIVDQGEGPSTASKGVAIWGRTLEALDGLGVARRAVAEALPFVANNYYSSGRPIARVAFGPLAGSRFGQPISLPQPRVEQILLDRLAELGVEVEWRVRLSALRQRDDHVEATLLGPTGDTQLEGEWVVGCDGARSSVRKLLGIEFRGRTYGAAILLADGVLESDLAEGELHIFMGPSGACVVVPMPGGLSRVYVSALRDDPTDRPIPTLPLIQSLIDAHGPGGLTMHEPRWMSAFRAQSRQAVTWRRGRAMLAGDAAHIHSPAGGQGMNLAIRDAHNLGWKLAAVVRGASPAPLMTSYERERARVAARVIRETDQQMRALALSARPARALRDAAFRTLDRRGMMAHQLPVMAGLRDTYRRSPLNAPGSAGPRRRRESLRPGQRLPDFELVDARTDAPVSVLTLLRDPRFSLFLRHSTDAADDAGLLALGRCIRERFGADVAVRIVLDRPRRLPAWPDSALIDRRRAFFPHGARYDAVLVRPDGHLAAVVSQAHADRLPSYLARTLRPHAERLTHLPFDSLPLGPQPEALRRTS